MNRWLLLLMVVVISGCDSPAESTSASQQLVALATVTRSDLTQPMSFSGVSEPAERAELAFQSNGVLRVRTVRIGDEVSDGELLAALENPDLEPGRQAAEATLARLRNEQKQAQRNVNRLQDLFSEGAVGEQTLEEEQTRLGSLNDQIRQARAQLASDEDRLADAQLSAPFTGLVGQVNFEVGEYVRAGEPVLVLGGIDLMEVTLALPTTIWKNLTEGQSVPLQVLGLDENQQGEIYDIGALADPATGLFPVVVRFNSLARSGAGQRVMVEFQRVKYGVMQVPLTAVADPVGGAPKVYRVESGIAYATPVEIIGFAGEQVAIRADLHVDDQVVVAGHMSLVDGQRVNVMISPGSSIAQQTL